MPHSSGYYSVKGTCISVETSQDAFNYPIQILHNGTYDKSSQGICDILNLHSRSHFNQPVSIHQKSPLNSFACLCWYSGDFFQIYTQFFTASYYLLHFLQSSLISASNNPFTRPKLHHSSMTCLILCGFFSNTGGIFELPVTRRPMTHNRVNWRQNEEWT